MTKTKAAILEAAESMESAEQGFLNLCRRTALGETPAPATIHAVCAKAGKGIAEFDDQVSGLQHRAKLREQMAERDDLKARRQVLDAELKAHGDKLAESVRDHRAAVKSLQIERQELTQKINSYSLLKSQLVASNPDRGLHREFATAQASVAACERAVRVAKENVARQKVEAGKPHGSDQAAMQARVERAEDALKIAEENLREASEASAAAHKALIEF